MLIDLEGIFHDEVKFLLGIEGGGANLTMKTLSGRNPAFNLYLYIDVYFFAILASQVRCYCILYLLSFIVTMYWTKLLYSNSHVLVYYIEGHYFFFVSIIGCHNCSYSAILNSFLYLQIQLYDTFSLSLLHVHWTLCCR